MAQCDSKTVDFYGRINWLHNYSALLSFTATTVEWSPIHFLHSSISISKQLWRLCSYKVSIDQFSLTMWHTPCVVWILREGLVPLRERERNLATLEGKPNPFLIGQPTLAQSPSMRGKFNLPRPYHPDSSGHAKVNLFQSNSRNNVRVLQMYIIHLWHPAVCLAHTYTSHLAS